MKRKHLILFSLSGLILCCDQLTKQYIHFFFRENRLKVIIPGFFSVTHTRTTGFVFGMLSQNDSPLKELIFIAIPGFALLLIILIYLKLRDNQLLSFVALSLILSGAFGNLIDRFHYGYVVDFLRVSAGNRLVFPVFNLADLAIITGLILVFCNTLKKKSSWVG